MTKHNIIITSCFLMYILALAWFIGYVMGARKVQKIYRDIHSKIPNP